MIRLLFVLILLGTSAAVNADDQSSSLPVATASDVSSELRRIGNQFRGSFGVLLTPVKGSLDPQVKRSQAYLLERIEEIAGQKFRESGVKVIVSIYSDERENASVMRYEPNYGREKQWKEKFSSPWPLREAAGASSDQTIIEVAVTAGLLRNVDSVGELAFTLGHELTHFFEGHNAPMSGAEQRAERWWSSQQNEVIADQGGIDFILGKYDLEDALSLLAKLSEGIAKSDLDALKAGSANHHHEGVRIGLAQAYIQKLKRTNTAAAPRAKVPLPDFLKLPVGRSAERLPTEKEIADLEYFYENTFSRILSAAELKTFELHEIGPSTVLTWADFAKREYAVKPDYDFILTETMRILQPFDSQTRIDTLIRVYSWLHLNIAKKTPYWKKLNAATTAKLERFMIANSKDWNPKESFSRYLEFTKAHAKAHASDSGNAKENARLVTPLTILLMASDSAQFRRVKSISQPWADYIQMATTLAIRDSRGEITGGSILNAIEKAARSTALAPEYRAEIQTQILAHLRTLDLDRLGRSSRTISHWSGYRHDTFEFTPLLDAITGLRNDKDKTFVAALEETLAPAFNSFREARLEVARKALTSTESKNQSIRTLFSTELGRSFINVPPTNAEITELKSLWSRFVKRPAFSRTDSYGFREEGLTYAYLAHLTVEEELAPQDKIELLKGLVLQFETQRHIPELGQGEKLNLTEILKPIDAQTLISFLNWNPVSLKSIEVATARFNEAVKTNRNARFERGESSLIGKAVTLIHLRARP
ncbi:MAG: M48 family metalloprotease, partial [Bdellovibrionota bacterium]